MTKKDDKERIERLKQIVASMPDKPGSYQYYDKDGIIIYVGKAKSLKNEYLPIFIKRLTDTRQRCLYQKYTISRTPS